MVTMQTSIEILFATRQTIFTTLFRLQLFNAVNNTSSVEYTTQDNSIDIF